MSLDVFTQRRQVIASQVRDLINIRGPRTATQKLTLDSLLREADDLETGISTEHERRQSVAFRNWLRGGNAMPSDQRGLLRHVESRDMNEVGLGTGSATGAGVFVPVGFERAVVSAMKDFSPLLALVNVIDAPDGRSHPYPSDDDAAGANGSGELLGEGQQASVADVGSPAQTILGSYKFSSKILKVSTELLTDQEVNLGQYLARRFGIRIARIASQYLTTGSGTNQPTGFLNSGSIINAGTAAGAGANDGSSGPASLGTSDFALLESAIDVAYRPNAKWMCHPSTLQKLRGQLDKQGHPLFPGLQNSPDGVNRIFNREIVTNPFMDQLQSTASSPQVTVKPIALADFSTYTCRRSPLVVFRMVERWAEYAQCGFLAFQRLGGNFTNQGASAAYLETIY